MHDTSGRSHNRRTDRPPTSCSQPNEEQFELRAQQSKKFILEPQEARP